MPDDYKNNPEFTEEWPRFFRMPVLMLMLITLLNDGKLVSTEMMIKVNYDDLFNCYIDFSKYELLLLFSNIFNIHRYIDICWV